MSKRDYYDILGLAKNSTEDDIKKAYRKSAMKYHPDRNQEAGAEDRFKEAKEAYEILSDPEKKLMYDQHGHAGANPFTHSHTQPRGRSQSWSFDPEDLQGMHTVFEEIFKNNMGRGFTRNSAGPVVTLTIRLSDAYTGRTVHPDSRTTVIIPAGIRSGTKLYVDGKLFKIDVHTDEKFKRSLDDLMVEVNISAIEAMLGVDAILEHLDGANLQFTIPAGIQSGQIVKLSKKGMKNPETGGIGDLLVRVSIQIPRTLTDADRTALRTISHRDSITI